MEQLLESFFSAKKQLFFTSFQAVLEQIGSCVAPSQVAIWERHDLLFCFVSMLHPEPKCAIELLIVCGAISNPDLLPIMIYSTSSLLIRQSFRLMRCQRHTMCSTHQHNHHRWVNSHTYPLKLVCKKTFSELQKRSCVRVSKTLGDNTPTPRGRWESCMDISNQYIFHQFKPILS